jgi:hypothetical protein
MGLVGGTGKKSQSIGDIVMKSKLDWAAVVQEWRNASAAKVPSAARLRQYVAEGNLPHLRSAPLA